MDSAVLPGNDAKCKEGVDSFASSTGLVCELGSADRAKCWAGVRFGVFSGISICRLHSHCLASQGGRESNGTGEATALGSIAASGGSSGWGGFATLHLGKVIWFV